MSILDEIARRRRATAFRRLGPPPGTLPEHFLAPARRPPVPAAPPVQAVTVAAAVVDRPVAEVTVVVIPEPPASTWTKVADDWVERAPPERLAPPEPDPVPRHALAVDEPRPPAVDLLALTSPPFTGELETTATPADPAPVASTALVRVTAPAPQQARIAPKPPSIVERTQLRRRIRFLRQLREIQLRDLGGFALELHRYGRDRPALTQGKLEAAAETDRELRQLEYALNGQVELRVVREAGIGGACVQCGAVYGTEDRFCSNCGEPLAGTPVWLDDRPLR